MNITPLRDNVIVKPNPVETTTKSGIIIPDSAKEKPIKGEVIACGKGKKDDPLTVKKGDIILYGKHSGKEIEIDDNKYLIMTEAEILAII